jgi:hypothetical protein
MVHELILADCLDGCRALTKLSWAITEPNSAFRFRSALLDIEIPMDGRRL